MVCLVKVNFTWLSRFVESFEETEINVSVENCRRGRFVRYLLNKRKERKVNYLRPKARECEEQCE